MITCVATITAALIWLLYECDWLRLRMLVGPNVTSCPWSAPEVRLTLTRKDFDCKGWHFSDCLQPLCGWAWIESHTHPQGDCTITITAWGVRSTATFTDNDPKRMKDYCTAALKPTPEQRREVTKQRRASKLALAC